MRILLSFDFDPTEQGVSFFGIETHLYPLPAGDVHDIGLFYRHGVTIAFSQVETRFHQGAVDAYVEDPFARCEVLALGKIQGHRIAAIRNVEAIPLQAVQEGIVERLVGGAFDDLASCEERRIAADTAKATLCIGPV